MALARPPMPILPRAARKGQVWPSPRSVRGPASQRVDQMIDQPSAVVGMEDGEVQALVGEPTPEYPEGQPEMMTITNAEGETGEAPEEDAILRGFRALLTVLGGGDAAYSGGGNIKVKPKKYASGGAAMINGRQMYQIAPGMYSSQAPGGVASTVQAPATGARIAYQQEQARVAAERLAARQRLDAMREPEEQRLQRESEEYKFAAGGLATPKTAQELALEEEDRLDAMRALRLEQYGAAAGIESVNESAADRARSERERAEDRAERDADRQANLREAEAARRAAEAEEKRYRDQLNKTKTSSSSGRTRTQHTPYTNYATGGRMLIQPKRYAEGGVAYVNSLSNAKIAALEAKERAQIAREELQAKLEAEDEEERMAAKAEARAEKAARDKPKVSTRRLERYKEADLYDLQDAGFLAPSEVESELKSRMLTGYEIADFFNAPKALKARDERERAAEERKKAAEKAQPKRYGADRLGRFKDDDLFEMVLTEKPQVDPQTGEPILNAKGDPVKYPLLTERELRAILKNRPDKWTDDEISVYLEAKKLKGQPALTPEQIKKYFEG